MFKGNIIDITKGSRHKKNQENLGKIPKGGGLKKTDENSQFQFGNLKNLGGVSIFQKCLNFNYLIV